MGARFYMPRGPFLGSVSLSQSPRYMPAPEEILGTPKAGTFYQVKSGDMLIRISAKAYGDSAKKAGLWVISDSTWNGTIRQTSKGYEVYKRKGLELSAKYSGPRTAYGSGKKFPVIWLPPASMGEPETVIGPPGPAPTPPGPTPGPTPGPVPPLPPAPGPVPLPPSPVPGPVPVPGGGRYMPAPEEVLGTPRAGAFYQVKKNDAPVRVTEAAYGAANRKAGLWLMSDSSWNGTIRQTSKGYEVYKRKGLEFSARYSGPRTAYGSGAKFPIVWLPPAGGGEPETVIGYKPTPIPVPVPPVPVPPVPEPVPVPPEPVPVPPEPEPDPPVPPPPPPPPPPGSPVTDYCPICGKGFTHPSGTLWTMPRHPPCPYPDKPGPTPPGPTPPGSKPLGGATAVIFTVLGLLSKAVEK